jgi:hypothetical protein
MKKFGFLGWAMAFIIAIIAFFHEGCSGCKSTTRSDSTTTVSYKYDTATHHGIIAPAKPETSFVRLPGHYIHDTTFIPAPVDSMAVVIAYYTARYYERAFSDSNIQVSFKDSVYRNELIWSAFDYRLLRPTAIVTTTVVKPVAASSSVYVGFGTEVGFIGFPTFGPELLYTSKNRRAYKLGYHFGQNMSTVNASIYWRIGK